MSATMRYRSASTVPGTNRASVTEPDDEIRPGEAGVLCRDAPPAGDTARELVGVALMVSGAPQCEQKRVPGGDSLAQEGHGITGGSLPPTAAALRSTRFKKMRLRTTRRKGDPRLWPVFRETGSQRAPSRRPGDERGLQNRGLRSRSFLRLESRAHPRMKPRIGLRFPAPPEWIRRC